MPKLFAYANKNDMPQTLRVNFIYMDEETKNRFRLASEELGWANRSLAQQIIHGYFARNKELYAEAASVDATARGMTEADYYRVLRDKTEDELALYVAGRPGFGPTPIDHIRPVPTDAEFKQKYNTITLSNYNYVLLRVARIVDTGPLTQVISRLVKHHFETYWAKNYEPQILLDQACKFK